MVVSGFKFTENKKLMRKIRSTEFKFEKGDGTELTCRITSIKTKDYSIEVNIKVIGSVVHRYRYTNEVRNFCISKNNYFTSAIRKNRFIRQISRIRQSKPCGNGFQFRLLFGFFPKLPSMRYLRSVGVDS